VSGRTDETPIRKRPDGDLTLNFPFNVVRKRNLACSGQSRIDRLAFHDAEGIAVNEAPKPSVESLNRLS
jgi:hypothetical protein